MKPILLTPALSRGARGLLEWQQADLAKAAQISLNAANNFERKTGTTRESTLQALQNAFEDHGIEFLSGGGVRHIDEVAEVTRFSGKNFITDWTYSIIRAGLKPGDEILSSSLDEGLWYHPDHIQSTKDFFAWLEKLNVKHKALVPDDKNAHPNPWNSYRVIPKELIGKITYDIYGQKIAFVLWKKKQVIVLHNAAVSETFRNQFNYLWRMGTPI